MNTVTCTMLARLPPARFMIWSICENTCFTCASKLLAMSRPSLSRVAVWPASQTIFPPSVTTPGENARDSWNGVFSMYSAAGAAMGSETEATSRMLARMRVIVSSMRIALTIEPVSRRGALCGLARPDRLVTREQSLGARDDGQVYHLAVYRERGAPLGRRFRVPLDHALRVRDFLRGGRVLLVDDGHLLGVDATRAQEAELARPSHHAAKRLPVAERGDARDVAERHDAGGARREDHLLLGHEQRVLCGLHAGFQREVLAA